METYNYRNRRRQYRTQNRRTDNVVGSGGGGKIEEDTRCRVSNFVANNGPLTSGVAVVSHPWRTVPSHFSGESVLDEAPCWSGRLATSCSGSLQMWP